MLRSLDHALDPIDPEEARDAITEVRRRVQHEGARPLSVSVPPIGVLAAPRRLQGPQRTAAEATPRPQALALRASMLTAAGHGRRSMPRQGEVAETMHWRRELLVLP